MHLKNAILFKVLLNKFHAGASAESFLKKLPSEEGKEIAKQPSTSSNAALALSWPVELLHRTHYSWLAPIVKSMPQAIQRFVIASLPEESAVKLQQLLKVSAPPPALTAHAKQFFLNKLYSAWKPEEAIPVAYLPPSTLSPLMDFSKTDLVSFIDFLALYDLSDAVRHIVNKNELKEIYLALTDQQQQFLRQCLHKNEKVTAPRITYADWEGSQKKLKDLLHRRGLLRLGKALCGQHPLFIWHLTHQLDTGRGAIIASYYTEQKIPTITPLLVEQVLSLINFLKQKSDK